MGEPGRGGRAEGGKRAVLRRRRGIVYSACARVVLCICHMHCPTCCLSDASVCRPFGWTIGWTCAAPAPCPARPPGPNAKAHRRKPGMPPPPAQAANEFWLRFEIDHCQLSKLPHRRRRHTRLPSGREACVHVHKLNRPVSGKGRRQHGIWKLLRRAATIVCSGKVQVSAWTVL